MKRLAGRRSLHPGRHGVANSLTKGRDLTPVIPGHTHRSAVARQHSAGRNGKTKLTSHPNRPWEPVRRDERIGAFARDGILGLRQSGVGGEDHERRAIV
ncbi:MAG: hypothetical protein WCE20_19540, partial [Rhizomicrobium sp.]